MILLSIKPEYAEKILNGEKRYEFRKVLPRRFPLKDMVVVLYASKPISKIVGRFVIKNILSGEPSNIWEKTGAASGIKKKDFEQYFSGRSVAHAIEVEQATRFEYPKKLSSVLDHNRPPQSFCYIKIGDSITHNTTFGTESLNYSFRIADLNNKALI